MSVPTQNERVDNEQLDKARAEELVSTIPLIPEVESVDVELYTDNTGDPASEFIFNLRREVKVDEEFAHRFIQFAFAVESEILQSDIGRFPYSKIKRAA